MPRSSPDIRRAQRVLQVEADAILAMIKRVDARFEKALGLLAGCAGKVIVTGMGKSGIICRKIAATLTSTGTPAIFLHAGEAIHGDAGVFVRGDVVVAISSSGETDEVLRLLPILKRFGLPLIALTGGLTSTLARSADVVLDVSVAEEACPLGLAPTASTTATLAMGDAMAVALLERKGFGAHDFAVFHPGGALGRKLRQVRDLMHVGADVPLVNESTTVHDALVVITGKRLGVAGVTNRRGELRGVITDGDLRRAWARGVDVHRTRAVDIMTRDPKTIAAEALAEEAVGVMETHSITCLFVHPPRGRKPIGIIHLHDLLKAGVV